MKSVLGKKIYAFYDVWVAETFVSQWWKMTMVQWLKSFSARGLAINLQIQLP